MHVRKLTNCFLFFIPQRYNTYRRYIKGIILHDDSKPFHISKNKTVSSWTLQNFLVYIFIYEAFSTHQYLLGPYIAMRALLFLTIFYTHRIFMILLFLECSQSMVLFLECSQRMVLFLECSQPMVQRNFINASWQL